jgi:hypothetical protein
VRPLAARVCCMAMNWLPSLRAIMIFGILLALFAAAYWACARHADTRHLQTNSAQPVPGSEAGS